MKNKVILPLLLLTLIILSTTAAVLAIEGSCVTYAQARAQGVQGTDAQLKSMGFCSGEAETTTAATTTPAKTQQAQETETEYPPGFAKSEYDPSGEDNPVIVQLNTEYFALVDQINLVLASSDYDVVGEVDSRWNTEDYNYWKIAFDNIDKINDEHQPCFDRCFAASSADHDFDINRCTAPCSEKREAAWDADAIKYLNIRIQLAKDALEEMKAIQSQAGPSTEQPMEGITEGSPGSDIRPGFNTDSGRGRDEFGRKKPSVGGYLGDAYVIRSDGTKVIPGKELYLTIGDELTTGKGARMNIMFSNAGRIDIGDDTKLIVGNALLDQFYLAKGGLKADVQLAYEERMEIRTRNGGIKVKGTEFVMEYNETTNTTSVYLNEGTLEVFSETQTITLTAGNNCIIKPDGSIESSQLMPEKWDALGTNFQEGGDPIKIYAWVTLALMIISSVASFILVRMSKPLHKEKNKKNLGVHSIITGVLGILTVLFPLVGYPLSAASITLARIQKIRGPTTTAKIGLVLGLLGVILNGLACLALLIYATG